MDIKIPSGADVGEFLTTDVIKSGKTWTPITNEAGEQLRDAAGKLQWDVDSNMPRIFDWNNSGGMDPIEMAGTALGAYVIGKGAKAAYNKIKGDMSEDKPNAIDKTIEYVSDNKKPLAIGAGLAVGALALTNNPTVKEKIDKVKQVLFSEDNKKDNRFKKLGKGLASAAGVGAVALPVGKTLGGAVGAVKLKSDIQDAINREAANYASSKDAADVAQVAMDTYLSSNAHNSDAASEALLDAYNRNMVYPVVGYTSNYEETDPQVAFDWFNKVTAKLYADNSTAKHALEHYQEKMDQLNSLDKGLPGIADDGAREAFQNLGLEDIAQGAGAGIAAALAGYGLSKAGKALKKKIASKKKKK